MTAPLSHSSHRRTPSTLDLPQAICRAQDLFYSIVDRKQQRKRWLWRRLSSYAGINCWHRLAIWLRSFKRWRRWGSNRDSWVSSRMRRRSRRPPRWWSDQWHHHRLGLTGLGSPWVGKMRPKSFNSRRGNYKLSWSWRGISCKGWRISVIHSELFYSAITEHRHSRKEITTLSLCSSSMTSLQIWTTCISTLLKKRTSRRSRLISLQPPSESRLMGFWKREENLSTKLILKGLQLRH